MVPAAGRVGRGRVRLAGRRRRGTRRRSCWPGWAPPPGCSASSTTRCARPRPPRSTLDTAGAFRFLRETGPLLAGAGFGVLLPDWVRKARLGLKLTTRSSDRLVRHAARRARFGLGDLVDFRYDLAVGDEVLDPAELAELARLKVPLVRLRGQWVELDDGAPEGRAEVPRAATGRAR